MNPDKKTKWIVVTGGVLSGLGKGTATASIGRLINGKGTKIVPVKCDGYLNVDPGTMNPVEHGEVFVLEDGGEVDMDFGHYERFLDVDCKFDWNLTSGKVFDGVISREREGKYLGQTIQIIPHVVDYIKEKFHKIAEKENADVMMIEIGGTLGDIENSWFVRAVKELKKDVGHENIAYMHLTYVPYLDSVGEPKTKPAQRDISLLMENGISPDIVIARSKELLTDKLKKKIAEMCDLEERQVISGKDIETIYEIPLMFQKEGMGDFLTRKFGFNQVDLGEWETLVEKIKNPQRQVDVAICGKYNALHDSYASIIEALKHAGAQNSARVNLRWVDTEGIEEKKIKLEDMLEGCSGLIVPGGFGTRGAEGKIQVIKFARENNLPFLGLCYGLQLAVVEYARNICGLNANSTEINENVECPVIDILPEKKGISQMGATLRRGGCEADIKSGTKVFELYGKDKVSERHRHRYEVNPEYHAVLEKNGLVFSGTSCNGRLAEFVELPEHKFFVATQAHPELKSRLMKPAPLFKGFVEACLK